jgi:polysaccharide biosynthesis transport protein
VAENEESSLPETLDKLVGLLKRRRWWILAPACLVALLSSAYVMKLPDRFKSEATLVYVPQQVSQKYVEPSINSGPDEAIQSMTREILSRTRLLGIIEEFGLYEKERQRLPPEMVAEKMREDDVEIAPLDQVPGREVRAFKISFSAGSAQLAQTVTSRLTSLFIEENLRTRGQQAASTTNFLGSQIAAAEKKMAEQEQRLRDFMGRNMSVLPDQQQTNLGILIDLRMRLQSTTMRLTQVQQQRSFLAATISGNLSVLQSERSALLSRYTEKHAEVIKKNLAIAKVQALLDRLNGSGRDGAIGSDPSLPDDSSTVQMRNQVDAIAADLATLSKEQKTLELQISQLQDRMNLTPMVAQQLGDIQRDADVYKQDYMNLLKNQMQARLTANLEGSQDGQQFRIADAATRPIKPAGPKRLRLNAIGAGVGIVLGIALALIMDFRDHSVHTENDLKRQFQMPLFVGIPVLLTPKEQRNRTLVRTAEWLSGSALMLAVLAAELYVFRNG